MAYTYSNEIVSEMRSYYAQMYNTVGLKNVEEMVSWRFKEEESEAARISKLEYLLNFSFAKPQKHLIVGTGTGGLAVELYKRGCWVYGIEPNEQANRIVQLKAKAVGMPVDNFTTDKAESMPFKDNTFDFVHCVSVIEHVNDVEKSLNEMMRVLNVNGYIYLSTPNYLFPYERHYKIAFPLFSPKAFGYLYLFFKGKPWGHYGGLKFVTERNVSKILYKTKYSIVWQRFYEQYSYLKCRTPFIRQLIWRFLTVCLNIAMNQEILIRKVEAKQC
jgi:ubiquinone/menaquinone biosynthesis C-methylase UbiE